MSDWDSSQYTKFEKERTQPSIDLISRLNCSPQTILDIGCGPGNSTNRLFRHFPDADILGIDASDNMLQKAQATYRHLKFGKYMLPDDIDKLSKFDLIFSNACLHWIPNHSVLLPQLADKLNSGGTLAVQMPLVQNAVFYQLLDKILSDEKWKKLRTIKNFHNLSSEQTYDILSKISGDISMWETTYYHIVPSHKDVIDWYKGSGLRPYLDMLNPTEAEEFLSELYDIIKENYPLHTNNTVILKMPRLFFTLTK